MTPDDWWRVRILELVNDITCVKIGRRLLEVGASKTFRQQSCIGKTRRHDQHGQAKRNYAVLSLEASRRIYLYTKPWLLTIQEGTDSSGQNIV